MGDDDDNSFITCSSSLVKFFNPMFVGDKDDESVGLSDGNDLSRGRLTRVQSELDMYEDVLPVKDTVFKGHTKWFGMTFRKGHIERAFLDGQARLHKNAVYYGYMLYVLVLLSNYLYGYIYFLIQTSICGEPLFKDFCLTNYGEGPYLDGQSAAEDPQYRLPVGYADIISSSLFEMTPWCAGILLALLALGFGLHWYFHRSRRLKNKSWALLLVWAIYLMNLIVMMLTAMVFAKQPENIGAQWPTSVFFVIVTLSTLLLFFSGIPFALYFLWWIVAAALFFGLCIPVILPGADTSQGRASFTPIIAGTDFISITVQLTPFGAALLIGAYLNDIRCRKRFLQRILMINQQEQIIREKTKNERMQRNFLENILPPSLVGDLKEAQQVHLQSTFKRTKSLSQRHMGVSMLFADLVGFTSYSAQVDPFKVMVFLNDLFQVFDGMCDEYNVYKIETIGDCYVAAVGVVTGELVSPSPRDLESSELSQDLTQPRNISSRLVLERYRHHNSKTRNASTLNARDLVAFAKAMTQGSRDVMKPIVNTPAIMRVGIHTGSCMSGIIGTKNLKFCLLGDAVATAAEMESTGTPDCIHASEALADLVSDEKWEKCKVVRGLGMNTYLLRV